MPPASDTPEPPAPPEPRKPPLGQPKRYKLALLTWIGIYPTITSILWFLLPVLLPRFPLPIVTLIITAIVVPAMSYVVMPLLLRRFGDWSRR